MNYQCLCCGFPKLSIRTMKTLWPFGMKLVNFSRNGTCGNCKSTFDVDFIILEDKSRYSLAKFYNIDNKTPKIIYPRT